MQDKVCHRQIIHKDIMLIAKRFSETTVYGNSILIITPEGFTKFVMMDNNLWLELGREKV